MDKGFNFWRAHNVSFRDKYNLADSYDMAMCVSVLRGSGDITSQENSRNQTARLRLRNISIIVNEDCWSVGDACRDLDE